MPSHRAYIRQLNKSTFIIRQTYTLFPGFPTHSSCFFCLILMLSYSGDSSDNSTNDPKNNKQIVHNFICGR